MLHKSFKSSKCKTSLKLATSRIKLMRNKKGVQINQMNRDLAQLLQTGQDRTARIRVEHVIREEKMVAAYDLIEIYCELIVARLPIIESQKTCPIDLKEAVTSVIFAAPRCSDIPELANIQKQFKAKYGKDFVSAAIELRPDCGVSRMLVEKLSAVAPDVQTKVKVLSAVAKEHNIDWDATSFEMTESKPQNDLLNGPSNIEKVSMETTDPPKVQPSYVNAVPSHEEKRNAPINYSEQNKRFTLGSQNTTPTDNDVETSSATHGDMSSSGTTSERMEKRENWNMEFKDATSAAHAAAESAERAAMAARAAAQFSKEEKVAKQRPAGSHVSNSRDETHVSAPSGSIGEGRLKDSYERSSDDRKPKITSQHVHQSQHNTSQKATESSLDDRRPKIVNQHVDQNLYDTSHRATERYGGNTSSSRPTSFKSNDDKIEDGKFESDVHMEDEYFEDFKTEIGSSQKERSEYENSYYFADEASRKQPSIHSSRSHSSDSGDELDVPVHDKAGKKSVVGNPFADVNQGNLFKETTNTSSYVDSPRDDEVISDDDGPKFDTGFDYDEVEATHSLENSHIWSPRRNTSSKSHLFTESASFGDHSIKSVERSEADDREPASFDHFDGPDSDSESEIVKFDPEPSPQPRKTRIELNDLVEGESSIYDSEDDEKKPQSQRSTRRLLEENELKKHNEDQESYDTLEDRYDSLNFGTLTGGLRNKGGLRFPPYTKSATTDTSTLSKKSTEESSIKGIETSIGSSLGSRVSKVEDKKPSSDSDSDDKRDNLRVRSSEKASKQANTRLRFTPPVAFVDDDGSDSDEDVAKQVPSRPRLGPGLSRRTRGTPSVPHLKSHVDSAPERIIPTYSEEVPVEPRSYTRKYKEEQVPDKQPPVSPLRKTAEIGSTKSTTSDEPKISTREHIPSRSTVESGKNEASKKQDMASEKVSGESLVKKASHVHPKLPDYESLAARLQSLRTNNK